MPAVDLKQWRGEIAVAKQRGGAPVNVLKRIGSLALNTPATSGADLWQSIVSQLPVHAWPQQKVLIVAVSA